MYQRLPVAAPTRGSASGATNSRSQVRWGRCRHPAGRPLRRRRPVGPRPGRGCCTSGCTSAGARVRVSTRTSPARNFCRPSPWGRLPTCHAAGGTPALQAGGTPAPQLAPSQSPQRTPGGVVGAVDHNADVILRVVLVQQARRTQRSRNGSSRASKGPRGPSGRPHRLRAHSAAAQQRRQQPQRPSAPATRC